MSVDGRQESGWRYNKMKRDELRKYRETIPRNRAGSRGGKRGRSVHII